ncbi:MAG: hypothetical protein QNK33_04475 [Bacteroidales bacterium]|nr:hypothetical protein [Bacteroidales bacterium]
MEKRSHDKKQHNFVSPDLSKQQEVIIDFRTKIYIPLDADPEEARKRFKANLSARK